MNMGPPYWYQLGVYISNRPGFEVTFAWTFGFRILGFSAFRNGADESLGFKLRGARVRA